MHTQETPMHPVTEKIQAPRRPVRVPTSAPTSPTHPAPVVAEPTLDQRLDATDAALASAVVEAARATLANQEAVARRGIPVFRRVAPEAEALITRAEAVQRNASRLRARGCPQSLLNDLAFYLPPVEGIPPALRAAEAALAVLPNLPPGRCQRKPGEVGWPGYIEGLRSGLLGVGTGADKLRQDLNALREYVEKIEAYAPPVGDAE